MGVIGGICRSGIATYLILVNCIVGLWIGFGSRSIDPVASSATACAVTAPASPTFQTIPIQDTVGLPDDQSQSLPEDTLTENAPKQEATGVIEWLEYPGDAFVPYPVRIAVRDGVILDIDGKDTNASLKDLISTKYVVGDADGTDVTRLLCRTIDLEMPKPDGSIAELSVIRPLWWLQGPGAAVGGSIDIGLHEIGLSGSATILAIGPCDVDSRETRPGMSIVTGKIRHRNATVWDLTFDGRTEETLGVTTNHPLYSETRHAWIPAGDLQLDEVVRTLNGHSTLTARTQRPTRETVFNIEVHRSHAYHVSGLGVLAHNTGLPCPPASNNYVGRYNASRAADGKPRLPKDWDGHHRIPQRYMDHPQFREFDFHNPTNIRGVRGSRSTPNTHQKITNLWEDFHRDFPNATRSQIEAFAHHVDELFYPDWFK